MGDEALISTRPSAESRRQQILDAAGDCVRQAGFHGASMGEIAKAAGLSVGQIYRYFENKEAIMAAIVAEDLAGMRGTFAALESHPGALVDALTAHMPEAVDKYYDPRRAALVLEVLAEAARNPKVAAIVRAADLQERGLTRAVLQRSRKPDWSDSEFEARAEMIAVVLDGLIVRGVNNPDADRVALTQVLRSTLDSLLR
jgi:AcrR family transcriptional regulator